MENEIATRSKYQNGPRVKKQKKKKKKEYLVTHWVEESRNSRKKKVPVCLFFFFCQNSSASVVAGIRFCFSMLYQPSISIYERTQGYYRTALPKKTQGLSRVVNRPTDLVRRFLKPRGSSGGRARRCSKFHGTGRVGSGGC